MNCMCVTISFQYSDEIYSKIIASVWYTYQYRTALIYFTFLSLFATWYNLVVYPGKVVIWFLAPSVKFPQK